MQRLLRAVSPHGLASLPVLLDGCQVVRAELDESEAGVGDGQHLHTRVLFAALFSVVD